MKRKKSKVYREVTKFSKTTDKLLGEYSIDFLSVEELRPLFDIGDDHEMYLCYPIKTPEQIAFFRGHGIPITDRAEFFVECYEAHLD